MALAMPRGISGAWAAFVSSRKARAADGDDRVPAVAGTGGDQEGNVAPLADGPSRGTAETETPAD